MVRLEKKLTAMATLVYHTGALGDFITAVPALSLWKARNKNHRLVLLGNPAVGEFAKDAGVVDDYGDVDDYSFLPLFLDDFSPDVNKILSPFHAAILFAAPDSPVISNFKQSGIKKLFWQPPFPASRTPAVDYHLSLFTDPQSLEQAEKVPRFTFPETLLKKSLNVIPEHQTPVALHPGSGSRKKNWPFERWLLLAESLRKKRIPLVWLLGPAERRVAVPSHDYAVVNQPLSLCAALLSRCRAFVGNDSGMAHLAAAAGCRTVALFGPSDPAVWAPRGRDVRVIYKPKPCSPCHRSATAPLSCDKDCMRAITVEKVLDNI
jgi:ADP-heptose:LPS heptosyltransferase